MFIYQLADALKERGVGYAFRGAYALARHGVVRDSGGCDLALKLEKANFLAAEAAMRSLGLEPMLPVEAAEVFEFRREYIKNRGLTRWGFVHPQDDSRKVYFSLTHALSKDDIRWVQAGSRSLPILASEASSGPSRLISLKVPEPLLAAFRTKAQLQGTPYQTQIKTLMAEWLNR